MRSLVISRWSPLRSDGGAALRNAQNLAALAGMGPVDVMTIGPGAAETRPLPGGAGADGPDGGLWHHIPLAPRRHVPGSWLLPGRHPLIDRYRQPLALDQIAALPRHRYDLALVEEIALAPYVTALAAAGIHTVFDAHNVEARLRSDIGGARDRPGLRQRLQDRRLRRIEAAAVAAADHVWACSALDADLLGSLYRPKGKVAVVPNAVDIAAYEPARAARAAAEAAADEPPLLLYLGTYSYAPNEAAALRLARQILPALRLAGIEAHLALVGREPTAAMLAAAAADPAITVTGAVDSPLPWLARATLMVLPITLGSGTRLKVLEAFAAGCPVISTAKGAEGIEIRPGLDIALAETDADFIAGIARLLGDPETRARMGAAGHDSAARQYSWAAAATQIRRAIGAASADNIIRLSESSVIRTFKQGDVS